MRHHDDPACVCSLFCNVSADTAHVHPNNTTNTTTTTFPLVSIASKGLPPGFEMLADASGAGTSTISSSNWFVYANNKGYMKKCVIFHWGRCAPRGLNVKAARPAALPF